MAEPNAAVVGDIKLRPPNFPARTVASSAACVPKCTNDTGHVRIFDTTLRDGEQAPGAVLTADDKVAIARQLGLLRVDIIEAGFPIVSPAELHAVQMVVKEVGSAVDAETGYVPVIAACARCNKEDIDAAWEAVGHAVRPRVCVFISTSRIHMEAKLKKSPAEVLALAQSSVAYAKSIGISDIQFVAEDASRSDAAFLHEVYSVAVEAGATTIGITDTVGYSVPGEFAQLVAGVVQHVRGADRVVVGVHCHNDLGLAVANTLAGLAAGARHADVTVNGIGERAGNAALEEVVMALRCRRDVYAPLHTTVHTHHIAATSHLVAEAAAMAVQANKAVVGTNAFAHASGLHQDGMLKDRLTYEIMAPEDVGIVLPNPSGLVLSKHSTHALYHGSQAPSPSPRAPLQRPPWSASAVGAAGVQAGCGAAGAGVQALQASSAHQEGCDRPRPACTACCCHHLPGCHRPRPACTGCYRPTHHHSPVLRGKK